MLVARKIIFLFRKVCFIPLLRVVKLLYYAEEGKGQPCLKPTNAGFEILFVGIAAKTAIFLEPLGVLL